MTGNSRPRWNLTAKFFAGTLSGLILISVFFLIVFVSVYRNGIETAHRDAADRVSGLLETSLKQAMLERELHRLQPLIDGLAAGDDVHAMRILNPAGEIRFSSLPSEFGRRLDTNGAAACVDCDEDAEAARSTRFLSDAQGRDILRAVKPVANEQECRDCHPPVSQQPVNGFLVVDYDGSGIQRQARNMGLLFVGAGMIVFILTVAGGTWFMRRFVLQPVGKLHHASQRLMHGDWDTRVTIRGDDEFSELGKCFNKMTDELKAQLNMLREKEDFMQGLVDAVPDGIRVIDESYGILLVNNAYREQLALEKNETICDPCYLSSHRREDPCPPTLVHCPHHELMQGGPAFKSIHRHIRRDGHNIDVEVYAAPLSVKLDGQDRRLVVESIRDLKEQVRFSHEQKLSELGQLAAGVAHEVFNPLSAAKMKLDATLAAIDDGQLDVGEILASLDVVDNELGRSMETADRLLKLSRFAGNTATLVDVNSAVSETLSLLNHEATEHGIEMRQSLGAAPVRALCNESELRLVVLNLAQNAFHAMPEGGVVTVTTGRDEGRTRIVVEDNGVGISTDSLPHIFEPFFSRRATDRNTGAGLGLAISRTNVRRHDGDITVASRLGEGTRFTVSFPDPDSKGTT